MFVEYFSRFNQYLFYNYFFQKSPSIHHYSRNQDENEKIILNIGQDIPDHIKEVPTIHATGTEANDVKDFTLTKSDPKYQTLPYNTKFTVNLLNRISKPDQYDNIENVNRDINKEECSNNISTQSNGNFNLHMTVHSAPLSVLNKNVAIPLNQQDLLVRKNGENKDQCFCNGTENTNHILFRENTHPIMNISTSVTTTYQVRIAYIYYTTFFTKKLIIIVVIFSFYF